MVYPVFVPAVDEGLMGRGLKGMRFKAPKKEFSYIGKERVVKKRCLLPTRIGDEIVWLETVWVRQQYKSNREGKFWENKSIIG